MTSALFGLLVVVVAAAVVGLVAAAARRATLGPRPAALVAGVLAVWLAVTGLGAAVGALALDGGPPRVLVLPWVVLIAAVVGLRTAPGRALVAAASPKAVVALEVFRVPVELVLWRLCVDGRLAPELTFHGRNFDIVIGLTAIPIAVLAWGRRPRPRLALAWHALGLALLVNIVAMAALSAPGPQHGFDVTPATTVAGTFPYVWLPGLLVPLAALAHVVGILQALAAASPSRASHAPR